MDFPLFLLHVYAVLLFDIVKYTFTPFAGRRELASDHGLAYDVVIKLCESLQQQGNHVYFDNFYTSVALSHLNHLNQQEP